MSKEVKYFDNQDLIDSINSMKNRNVTAGEHLDRSIFVYFHNVPILSIPKDALSIFQVDIVDNKAFQKMFSLELQSIEDIIQKWLSTPPRYRKRVAPKYRLISQKFFQGNPMYVKSISFNCDYEPNFKVEFTTDKDLAAEFSEEELESFKFCYPRLARRSTI